PHLLSTLFPYTTLFRSPHKFGIPQIRDRLFIVGNRSDLTNFHWPIERSDRSLSILSALSRSPNGARKLSATAIQCLEVWQDFLRSEEHTSELQSLAYLV